jgi:heptaprenylglyceryl phosphate synthase
MLHDHDAFDRSGRGAVAAIHGAAMPLLCTIDPFKLRPREAAERAMALWQFGITHVIVGSTDDEGYDAVVPDLIAYLKRVTPVTVIEHFRPTKSHGFRRAAASDFVMMTTVGNSRDELYSACSHVEGIGDTSRFDASQREHAGVVKSRAFVFGADCKSARYVGVHHLPATATNEFGAAARMAAEANDVIYLFSRAERLSSAVCRGARAAAGSRFPIIVSGRIKTPAAVREALEAGASAVVIGSLLEEPGWHEQIESCAAAAVAFRDARTGSRLHHNPLPRSLMTRPTPQVDTMERVTTP